MNVRKLAIILSSLRENPNPKYKLEQYSITPEIAAVTLILAKNDIENKIVYDLGCGIGRFAIGAALLGAKKAVGIDLDEAVLEIAESNAKTVQEKTGVDVTERCEWVCKDVRKLRTKADTVIQFPPFASDVVFFRKALEISENVYSIHKLTENTKKSLTRICEALGWRMGLEKNFKYKLAWKEGGRIGHEVFLLVAKKLKV